MESSFVSLDEDTHEKLIWTRNEIDGHYTTKKGYEVAIMEQFEGEKPWWWHDLWYSNSLLKTILTFWLDINNKLLTWENLRKRGLQGLGLCILCKKYDELTSHLLGTYPYAGQVWTEASRKLSQGRMGDWKYPGNRNPKTSGTTKQYVSLVLFL